MIKRKLCTVKPFEDGTLHIVLHIESEIKILPEQIKQIFGDSLHPINLSKVNCDSIDSEINDLLSIIHTEISSKELK